MDKIDIEIDEKSGFCYGVVRAIEQAELFLEKNSGLLSLGSIVHNESEIKRLERKGLHTINSLDGISDATVLIRAHGEPPSTYLTASRQNLRLIDCTCPVVLRLQQRIRKRYEETKYNGGSIMIIGKKGHAEVNGLVGQAEGNAIVIEKASDLDTEEIKEIIESGNGICLFSQTTKEPDEFAVISGKLSSMIEAAGGDIDRLEIHNTICAQVSSRHPHLKDFAERHSIVIFVCGRESSNGKVLYNTCLNANRRSFKIESKEEIKREWFRPGDSVGICGATSTPKWQLQEIAEYIKSFY